MRRVAADWHGHVRYRCQLIFRTATRVAWLSMDAPCAWTVASGVELAAMIAVPLTKAAISGLPEVWYQVVTCAPQVPVPAAVLAGADVVLSDARVVLVLSGTDVMLVLAGTDVVLVLSATDVVLAGADVVLAAGVLTAALPRRRLLPRGQLRVSRPPLDSSWHILTFVTTTEVATPSHWEQCCLRFRLRCRTSHTLCGRQRWRHANQPSWSRRCQTQWPHTLPPPPVLQHRRCRVPGQR